MRKNKRGNKSKVSEDLLKKNPTFSGLSENPYNLSQIYPHGSIVELALGFVKDGNVIASTPWVTCKDFFNEVFLFEYSGHRGNLYGFKYPYKTRISVSPLIVLMRDVTISAKKAVQRAKRSAVFMRVFDRKAGFTPTKLYVTSTPGIVAFKMDTRWSVAPPILSAMTALLRVGLSFPIGGKAWEYLSGYVMKKHPLKYMNNDASYLKTAVKQGLLKKLVEQNVSLFNEELSKNYPGNMSVNTLHNGGILLWTQFQQALESLPVKFFISNRYRERRSSWNLVNSFSA